MSEEELKKYHEELLQQFGSNFGFVAEVLDEYLADKSAVSDYWQNYFDKLTGSKGGNGQSNQKNEKIIRGKEKEQPAISDSFQISAEDEAELIAGVGAKVIENMDTSLSIPIATSLRAISVKLLEENRIIINQHLKRMNSGKVSFTHIVAFAIVQALKNFSNMNNSFAVIDGKPHLIKKPYINLGIAVDITRKNGSRTLIVPNIKQAEKKDFKKFISDYNTLVERARSGKIEPSDFQGTTITITNPGGMGTVSSNPRLMTGQGCILAIGVIDYPAEFKAMHETALAAFGVGKVMNVSSTYDHRIIQGAESGEFLKELDNLLLGNENFYDKLFEDIGIPQKSIGWDLDTSTRYYGKVRDRERIEKQAKILQLINMYRVRGHHIANLNPLSTSAPYHQELDPANYDLTIWDYDRFFITGTLQGLDTGTLREILDVLRQTYCEKIGVEYMHIQNPEEKIWLQSKMEPVKNNPEISAAYKKRIMQKLIISEGFEHFLHTRFIGHKRFSLEGSETLIPVLDCVLEKAADDNVEEIFLGMAHRGRLNVLSNIIGKSYEKIFSEFEDELDPDTPQGTGDVKYHLGASGTYTTSNNRNIKVSIASNPSHLEWVNPVVEGIVRAKQTRIKDTERSKVIPLLIHGDAAFAGQGVVAETINLSQLKGYRTGGTIHIIINNQIGFTTAPAEARSSSYATDVAKMVQAPIFHVNGDDPEASVWVTELAYLYRQRYKKDVVIDLFGYRRHGHNEGDDPVYTQPIMYKKIKSHPSVKQLYENILIAQGIFSEKEIKKLDKNIFDELDKALKTSKKKTTASFKPDRPLAMSIEEYEKAPKKDQTKVSFEQLSEIVKAITKFPDDFAINPKLQKHIGKRKELLTGNVRIDWAFAEALAFGSLLQEGIPVRLSGQDSARGTFSQRHLIFTDMNNGSEYLPHNSINNDQAKIEALDSLLSEAAVLGFEYGYSSAYPLSLVLWEAQFGDFANSAQVIIDNFIVCSETKWKQPNNLTLLLPHGQEGQGPEHSSARIERFLTLCAENNMYVCYPTTPAQYFHLLRRQILNYTERPLIVFTPKSLLRLPAARSVLTDFTEGKYSEVIDDSSVKDSKQIKRVILTSGKVYYNLLTHKDINEITDTAIVRVEQYYPFPEDALKTILSKYSGAADIYWVQEEPENMGAWNFMFPKLLKLAAKKQKIKYVGRNESPSPAAGSSKMYQKNQDILVNNAFK